MMAQSHQQTRDIKRGELSFSTPLATIPTAHAQLARPAQQLFEIQQVRDRSRYTVVNYFNSYSMLYAIDIERVHTISLAAFAIMVDIVLTAFALVA